MIKVTHKGAGAPVANAHYVVSDEHRVAGCLPLRPGRTFRVTGKRGQFVFVRHVFNPHNEAEWIDCYPYRPADRHPQPTYSVDPARIKSVSRAVKAPVRNRT